MAQIQNLTGWINQLPVVTRAYAVLAVVTTVGCSLEIVSPYQLYLNFRLIIQDFQIWRLITCFLFFGRFGLDFVFQMFFLVKYSRSLEEGSFRGKSADFLWMIIIGSGLIIFMSTFVSLKFLGPSLTFMMVYIWSKRHPYVQLNFFGVMTFRAPYLPWVLLLFTFIIIQSQPSSNILGIIAGHIYYFLEDVYPQISGKRYLKTPQILNNLFNYETDIPSPTQQQELGNLNEQEELQLQERFAQQQDG